MARATFPRKRNAGGHHSRKRDSTGSCNQSLVTKPAIASARANFPILEYWRRLGGCGFLRGFDDGCEYNTPVIGSLWEVLKEEAGADYQSRFADRQLMHTDSAPLTGVLQRWQVPLVLVTWNARALASRIPKSKCSWAWRAATNASSRTNAANAAAWSHVNELGQTTKIRHFGHSMWGRPLGSMRRVALSFNFPPTSLRVVGSQDRPDAQSPLPRDTMDNREAWPQFRKTVALHLDRKNTTLRRGLPPRSHQTP